MSNALTARRSIRKFQPTPVSPDTIRAIVAVAAYAPSWKNSQDKRAIKRGLKIELLEQVVALLAMGEPLPDKNRDHDLSGDWAGHRECHILPDWLLVYRIEDDVLVLTLARTGTHSDLFGK